jgi:hypothetical protein
MIGGGKEVVGGISGIGLDIRKHEMGIYDPLPRVGKRLIVRPRLVKMQSREISTKIMDILRADIRHKTATVKAMTELALGSSEIHGSHVLLHVQILPVSGGLLSMFWAHNSKHHPRTVHGLLTRSTTI